MKIELYAGRAVSLGCLHASRIKDKEFYHENSETLIGKTFVRSAKLLFFFNREMFKFLITLGIGIYAGLYISQNYEVPRVDDPSKIFERIKEFTEDHKKK